VRIGIVLLAMLVCAYFGIDLSQNTGGPQGEGAPAPTIDPTPDRVPRTREPATVNADLVEAMDAERSGVMLTVVAEVLKTLPDDRDGSRHQRFLLSIDDAGAPYDTLLIAHNIDLAPRVPLRAGDTVTVRGQYEWNDKGGVVHWTHHDPGDRREGGYILHDGSRYE